MKTNSNLSYVGLEELVEFLNQNFTMSEEQYKQLKVNPWLNSDEVSIAMAKFYSHCIRNENEEEIFFAGSLLNNCSVEKLNSLKVIIAIMENCKNPVYNYEGILNIQLFDEELFNWAASKRDEFISFDWVTADENCPEKIKDQSIKDGIGLYGTLLNKTTTISQLRNALWLIDRAKSQLQRMRTSNKKKQQAEYVMSLIKAISAHPNLTRAEIFKIMRWEPKYRRFLLANPNLNARDLENLYHRKSDYVLVECASANFPEKYLTTIHFKYFYDHIVNSRLLKNPNTCKEVVDSIINNFDLESEAEFFEVNIEDVTDDVIADIMSKNAKLIAKGKIINAAYESCHVSDEQFKRWCKNFYKNGKILTGEEYLWIKEDFDDVYKIIVEMSELSISKLFSNPVLVNKEYFLDRVLDEMNNVNSDNDLKYMEQFTMNVNIISKESIKYMVEMINSTKRPYFENLLSFKETMATK